MNDNRMKYITYVDENSNEIEIIFPSIITHKDMFKSVKSNQILGAGFCLFKTDLNNYEENVLVIKCFGESSSLNVNSRNEKDSKILQINYLGLDYVL